jgi:hypothetical protein
MFDFSVFIHNFYIYIKETKEDFKGDYDELYDIYSLNYTSSIVDTNSTEQNKYMAELLNVCDKNNTEISPESYKRHAYCAYGCLWNSVLNEYSATQI